MCKKINMNKEVEIGCPIHGAFFVTPNNHLGYNSELTAYGCPTCKDEKKIVITEENISEYYEFMGDEDLIDSRVIVSDAFNYRKNLIPSFFKDISLKGQGIWHGVDNYYNSKLEMTTLFDTWGNYTLKQSVFGVKDTLRPLDEYIKEIKASSEYEEYLAKKV